MSNILSGHKNEVVEGNRIIAEFIQFIDGIGRVCKYPFTPDKLKFHTSWDWLMPVIEKIWSLGGWEYCIFANGCTINGDHEQPPYISETESDTITATWKATIKFIQWYNSQNKQP